MTQHVETLKFLMERLQELQERVSHLDQEMHQLLPADFEEQAADLEGQDSFKGIEKAALQEITQIKHAIDRIKTGQYGICSQCGEPIAQLRLQAQPTATRCMNCAS
jgi:DnaK suppressor protein